MKIRMLQPYRAGSNGPVIQRGTVFEARMLTGMFARPGFQITEVGAFCGMVVPFEKCIALPAERTYTESEYVAVHQELLRRREEVRALTYKNEAHESARKRAESAADRLERELREAREAKKVRLPPEVAAAIDFCKESHNEDIDFLIWSIPRDEDRNEHMRLLSRWSSNESFIDLIDAIRYGYTIEEPPKPLEEELAEIVSAWLHEPTSRTQDAENIVLVNRILNHIRQKEQKSG